MTTLPLSPADGARLLATVVLRRLGGNAGVEKTIEALGGRGSGNFHHAGRPGEVGGSAGVTLTPVKDRAFKGMVTAPTDLSKYDTGQLGEQIAAAYLGKGARSLNTVGNNFPIDLVKGNALIEVKAGLSSNGDKAQQWRATIGQPGKKETAWLTKATDGDKRAWNAKKEKAILARKAQVVRDVSEKLGRPIDAKTVALIINPRTKTVDVHEFTGFHLRIGWKSDEAAKGYRGSFRYK
jgi:hypothetical protein